MEKMRANMIPRFHYSTKEEEQAILSGNWDAEKIMKIVKCHMDFIS